MRAFVHKMNADGMDRLGTGQDAGMVSPEYKRLSNLCRHFLDKLPAGKYHVEVFRNWDNRYGKPDIDFVHTN